jgi:hypothetical protein
VAAGELDLDAGIGESEGLRLEPGDEDLGVLREMQERGQTGGGAGEGGIALEHGGYGIDNRVRRRRGVEGLAEGGAGGDGPGEGVGVTGGIGLGGAWRAEDGGDGVAEGSDKRREIAAETSG